MQPCEIAYPAQIGRWPREYRQLFDAYAPAGLTDPTPALFHLTHTPSEKYGIFSGGAIPLLDCLNERIPLSGLPAVDLGSGDGLVVLSLLGRYGMDARGIDLGLGAVLQAQEAAAFLGQSRGRFVWGNIFHPLFTAVPERVKWNNTPPTPLRELADQGWSLLPPVENIRLFYIFQYGHNTAWLLDMLSELCSPGTFICAGGYDHIERSLGQTRIRMPDNIHVLQENDAATLLAVS